MKTFRLLPGLLTALIFLSCSGDNNPVSDPDPACSLENYAMLQTGNYWIYERHEIDSSERGYFRTNATDSVVVEGTRLYAGKQAYVLVAYGSDGKSDTMLLMTQGSGLFAPTHQVSGYAAFEGDCNCFTSRWERIADCGRQQWTSLDTMYFNEAAFPTRAENGSIKEMPTSVKCDIRAQKQKEGVDQVAGVSVHAKYFSISSDWRYDVRCSRNFNENPSSSMHSPYRHLITFGEDIGILKWKTSSGFYYKHDKTAPCNMQFIENPSLTGSKIRERTLIRYSVKK